MQKTLKQQLEIGLGKFQEHAVCSSVFQQFISLFRQMCCRSNAALLLGPSESVAYLFRNTQPAAATAMLSLAFHHYILPLRVLKFHMLSSLKSDYGQAEPPD